MKTEGNQLDNSAGVLRDLRAAARNLERMLEAEFPAVTLPEPWRLAAQVERPIRIVLADDHPVVRIGVRNMLSEEEGFDVVGEASDGDEAITQTLELEPDILLLDVQMPRLPGLEAMRAIMNGTPTVKILLLTSTITTQQIIEALQIGARGIVLKDALAGHLQTAIRTVSGGDYWIGGKRVVNLVSALHDLMQQAAVPQRKTYGLTPARAGSGGLHRRRLQQPRHRQAVQPERRNRQAPPVEHLRQDRCLHPPGTGSVRHRASSGRAAVTLLRPSQDAIAESAQMISDTCPPSGFIFYKNHYEDYRHEHC